VLCRFCPHRICAHLHRSSSAEESLWPGVRCGSRSAHNSTGAPADSPRSGMHQCLQCTVPASNPLGATERYDSRAVGGGSHEALHAQVWRKTRQPSSCCTPSDRKTSRQTLRREALLSPRLKFHQTRRAKFVIICLV